MLGLNILAGIAGIVFGMGVKGDLKSATAAKTSLEADAASAKADKSTAEKAASNAIAALETKKGEYNGVNTELDAYKVVGDLDTLKNIMTSSQGVGEALKVSQAEVLSLTTANDNLQTLANKAQKHKQENADYAFLGTVDDLRKMKKRLKIIDDDKAAKKAKTNQPKGTPRNSPKPGAEIGAIASYDPKFKFYVINRGSDHGIKAGDEFNVLRGGNLVGKIKIKQTQPTVSIADAVKEFTRQQLQAGDKVAKAN